MKLDILSLDNLLHSLVAVAFVAALSGVALLAGFWFDGWGFIAAALAGVGLYLREVSQVDWDFTLRGSGHKIAEAAVGTACGFVTAVVFAVAT